MAKQATNTQEVQLPGHFNGVYDEDVIEHALSKKIGIVIKTCRDDDSSDDDSDFSDMDEEPEKVEPGKVMVGWYNLKSKWNDDGEVEIVDENLVKLVDRSLLPGDVIRWVADDMGKQKGQVTSVSVLVNCRIIGTDYVLKHINAADLRPLLKYVAMTPVVKGPWLGIIKAVIMELTLRLKNGSRCIITGNAINNIGDVTDQREEDSTYYCPDFYPGQQVQSTARVFKEAKWISGTKPAISNQGRLTAIVEDVVVDSLDVEWQVCGYTGSPEGSLIQPSAIITRNELANNDVKVLTHFKEAHIQIGDKAYYVLKESDVKFCKESQPKGKKEKADVCASAATCEVADSDEPPGVEAVEASNDDDGEDSDYETEPIPKPTTSVTTSNARQVGSRPRRRRHLALQKKKKRYQPPVLMLPGERVCIEICQTKTHANTVWQDAAMRDVVVSTDLYPVIHLDELEFFPGDFVVDGRMDSIHQHDLGVIQSSDFEARLCSIKWLRFQNNILETVGEIEVDVSVYDIKDHEDYMFRAGDIAVRLSPHNTNDATNQNQVLTPAGQIVKVNTDGTVQVLWVDGTVTSVLPSQLYVVNEEDLEWGSDMDHSEGSDDDWEGEDEWETASETSDIATDEGALSELGHVMRSLNTLAADLTEASVVGMNQRTAQFISALGEQFSPSEWENSNDLVNAIGENSVAGSQEVDAEQSASSESASVSVALEAAAADDTQPAVAKPEPSATAECVEIPLSNESFSTMESTPDCHKFFNQTLTPHNARTFNSAVMRDIRLLKKDLPPGITVKSFEERKDLFSALIRGSPGTPYEDGLFYFDIQLPDNYPASPPQVHYHSYCSSRLNPNLYEGGKVCVSLLGTWSGTGSEKWTSKSTLHQLLLSIQGLILNDQPYFNEAGYEKHRNTPEGKENSRMYNEMAVIKMLQSIQTMISRPPDIFKKEVIAHFKEKLPTILERFETWLKCSGTMSWSEETKDIIPSYPLFPLSKGFCATIARMVDNLGKKLHEPPLS